MKTEISKEDYLKLVGLFTLARSHTKAIQEIEIAAAEIIKMEAKDGFGDNYYGHLSDEIWSFDTTSPDDTLKRLKIKVAK